MKGLMRRHYPDIDFQNQRNNGTRKFIKIPKAPPARAIMTQFYNEMAINQLRIHLNRTQPHPNTLPSFLQRKWRSINHTHTHEYVYAYMDVYMNTWTYNTYKSPTTKYSAIWIELSLVPIPFPRPPSAPWVSSDEATGLFAPLLIPLFNSSSSHSCNAACNWPCSRYWSIRLCISSMFTPNVQGGAWGSWEVCRTSLLASPTYVWLVVGGGRKV